jgi:hypothetical protein
MENNLIINKGLVHDIATLFYLFLHYSTMLKYTSRRAPSCYPHCLKGFLWGGDSPRFELEPALQQADAPSKN